MKKIDEIIKEKSGYHKDLGKIKKEIDFSTYKKDPVTPFKKWGWTIFATLLIGIITISTFWKIRDNKPVQSSSKENNNSVIEEDKFPIIPREKYETLAFKNNQEVVYEYEKNAAFIHSNYEMVKSDSAFQTFEPLKDLIDVDSTEFKKGEVGSYNISIAAKSNAQLKMNYEVQVVDQVIQKIELDEEKTRKTYYVGEPILKEDVYVNKICQDSEGKTIIKQAKRSEVEIDISEYNANQEGIYNIQVSLKSVEGMTFTYPVEVQSLDKINLDGDYYFHDDECLSGEVNVYVASIKEGILEPHFYEFYKETSGQLTYSFKNGRVILKANNSSQYLEYFPEKRVLKLSGMVDEEWTFYVQNDYDTTFFIDQEAEYHQFIAKDGYMDSLTISYMNYMYGGFYYDSSFTLKVEADDKISNGTQLYVGFTPYQGEEKPYIGTWFFDKDYFRMPYLIAFSLEEDGLFDGQSKKIDNYKIQKTEEGYILWLKENNEKYLYIEEYDTFIVYGIEHQLNRFNATKQCIVTLVTSHGTSYQVAVTKGKTVITGFASEGSYTQLEIDDYKNDPIEENTILYNVKVLNQYLFDLEGTSFGTYDDYYQIVSNSKIHFATTHQYLFVHYSNFEKEIIGYVRFLDISTLEVVSFKQDTPYLTFLFQAEKFIINEKEYEKNATLYAECNFIGTYKNEENEEIKITENGYFTFTEYIDRGGETKGYLISLNYRIVKMTENEVSIELNYVDKENDILKIVNENGQWKLTWDSQEYTLSLEENH